ncbi:A/G-specific adenine glycosylase [Nonlabens xiamenensis]|uniref:A/G-specific adenine glycosylase n=1 Tax=Nonlabens xiamenensis TaxID=2341043 RepID=UPI000F6120C9|nr:A/G-specific adenine glycosylase [Nonlabens xiamenensis]
MDFSRVLIDWYQLNKRDLPWRQTTDPYHIWLSEVILQQTRVNQGLPYYNRFVSQYPNVYALANASEQEVLKTWQGLGYYSRARNLHKAAQQVVENEGKFPSTYKDLLELKGVGDYTAAAIASFAYEEAVPVVDGNVYRVLARIYGIHTPINSTQGAKEFKSLAQKLLNKNEPATHNQAIMEFGAIQCVPKNPQCQSCPFQGSCVAYEKEIVQELPVKLKKTKVKNLYHHYLVAKTPSGKTLLQQRDTRSIWAGLHEFPYIEANGPLLSSELKDHEVFKHFFSRVRFRESAYNQEPIIHQLTHRKIHAYFWIIQTESELPKAISVDQAYALPLHILMYKFMNDYYSQEELGSPLQS